MATVKPWTAAPAGTYNPFANDDRCYAAHYIVGDDEAEVVTATDEFFNNPEENLSDRDVFYDATVEKWVGVTCRDA